MLHILVDTSTWLDLSKRRDGRRWTLALQELVQQGDVELMVPQVVIDEYERTGRATVLRTRFWLSCIRQPPRRRAATIPMRS